MHQKLEFVTVNLNSLNYGGGKIVFHRSVVKACFVFRNPYCPILETALHRLQLRIMSGPAGIRLKSVLSGYPARRKISCPVHVYSVYEECLYDGYTLYMSNANIPTYLHLYYFLKLPKVHFSRNYLF